MATIVLPIKRNTYHWDRNEFLRFARVGLPSLERFLDPSFSFLMIVPRGQMLDAQKTIQSTKLRLSFIAEEDLIGEEYGSVRGWTKQMLLKLVVADKVTDSHYLVLDADCILTKPFRPEDIFYGDRLIGCKEKWHAVDTPGYAVSTHWWRNSHQFLKPFMVDLESKNNMMSVTPEVLITREVRELMDKLKGRHAHWWNAFLASGATEFCTYWLHLMEEGKTHYYDLREEAPSLWTMDLTRSWLYNHSDITLDETVRNGFEKNENDFFIVVQSHTNVQIERLAEALAPYLA